LILLIFKKVKMVMAQQSHYFFYNFFYDSKIWLNKAITIDIFLFCVFCKKRKKAQQSQERGE